MVGEKKSIIVNHKAILMVMHKANLLAQIRRKRSYVRYSQQLHRYPNILNRQFTADKPNEKWVTDVSAPQQAA